MNKLLGLWQLFKVGYAVSDPAMWKKRQITATALAAVLLACVNLASMFGYAIPIDVETANVIAGGILGIVNTVLTVITTDKIGMQDEKQPEEKPVEVKDSSTFPDLHDFHNLK